MRQKKWLILCGVLTFFNLSASSWLPSSDDFWGTSSNWTEGPIPGIPGNELVPAIFPSLVPPIGSSIFLRQGATALDVALSNITFHNGYTVLPYLGNGLISAPTAGTLTITVDSSAHPEVQANMNFDPPQILSIAIDQGSSLTLSGTSELTNTSLSQTGSGELIITGVIENYTIAISPPPLTLDITGENIHIASSGKIQCYASSSLNGMTLTLEDSSLSIQESGQLNCIAAVETSNSLLHIDTSNVTMEDSGIIACAVVSGGSTGSLAIQIDHSIISMGESSQISVSEGGNAAITVNHSTIVMNDSSQIRAEPLGLGATITFNNSTIAMNDSSQIRAEPLGLGATITFNNSTLNMNQGTMINQMLFLGGVQNGSISFNQSTLNVGTGAMSLLCLQGNGPVNDLSFSFDNSNLSCTESLDMICSSSIASNVNFEMTQSTVSLQSGQIQAVKNTLATTAGDVTVSIKNDSTLTMDSGTILCSNQGGGNASVQVYDSILNLGTVNISQSLNSAGSGVTVFDIQRSTININLGSIDIVNVTQDPHFPPIFNIQDATINILSGGISFNSPPQPPLQLPAFQIQDSKVHVSEGISYAFGTYIPELASISIVNSSLNFSTGGMNVEGIGCSPLSLDMSGSTVEIGSGGILCSSSSASLSIVGSDLTMNNSTCHIGSGDINCFTSAQVESGLSTNFTMNDSTCHIETGNLNCYNSGLADTTLTTNLTMNNSSFNSGNGNIHCYNNVVPLGVVNSSAQIGINSSSVDLGSGSILCENICAVSNGAVSQLSIIGSSVTIDEGGLVCICGPQDGPANIEMDQSNVILNAGGIFCQSAVNASNLNITDSKVRLKGSGVINNEGNGSSVFTISNSNVFLSGLSGITASHSLDISGGLLNNGGTVQCLDGSILIQNKANVFNSGTFENLAGDILLSDSFLFTSGNVLASTTYTQTSQSILEIGFTSQNHGLVNANSVALDGSLLVNLDPSNLIMGESIPIVKSVNDFTSRFSNHQFINTPSDVTPFLFYSPNEIFILTTSSPVTAKIHHFNIRAVFEKNLRLQKQMAHLHVRMKHEQDPTSLLVKSDEEESCFIAYTEMTTPAKTPSVLAQQRPPEQLASRMQSLPNKPWSIYLGPIGSVGYVNKTDGQAGNSFSSVGVLGGFDYGAIGESSWPIGLGIGSSYSYQHNHSRVHQHRGHFGVDFVHGDLYSVAIPRSFPDLSLNVAVGLGYEWVQIERNTGVVSSPGTARGSTRGPEFDAMIGLEYLLADDATLDHSRGLRLVFPVFNVQFAHTSLSSYKEHGAGTYNLSVERQKWSAFWTLAGTRWSYLFSPSKNVRLRPELSLGWQRQWNHLNQGLTYATFAAPVPQVFTTKIQGPGKNSLVFGFDFNCQLYDTMFIEFDYDLIHNSNYLDNVFYLQYEYIF